MGFMFVQSLRSGSLLFGGFEFTWEWSNYSDALTSFNDQFFRSFVYAGVATLLCLLIAYPLAYMIAFRGGKWKNLLLFAVVAPFFTTYLIRTLAWQTILTDGGAVVDFMKTIGLVAEDGRVLDTAGSVIAGLTYNFLPFMILPIYASLERIDLSLIEAARDLYASSATAFRKVTLPLTAPGIVAGTLLTFIPAAGDYINAEFLGSQNQSMIGNVIQSKFLVERDFPSAAALSFVLMAVILVIVLIYIRFAGSEALMGEEAEPAR
jgi:spermidine/putrescine transport system permease protein